MKSEGQRITMLTCYDATFALVMDRAGVDTVLVGDSLGMVVQAATAPCRSRWTTSFTTAPSWRAGLTRAARRRHAFPQLRHARARADTARTG